MHRIHIISWVLLACVVAACGTALVPVRTINTKVVTSSGKPVGMQEIHGALVSALNSEGFTVEQERPGEITANKSRGPDGATVRVHYDAKTYGVGIVSVSGNINHDPEQGLVSRQYNHWVNNLDTAIQAQFAAL